MNFFAENIKKLRLKTGLNQTQMAHNLSLSKSTWSGYEQGTSKPNFDDLLRLSGYFGISLTEMVEKPLSDGNLINKTGDNKKGNLNSNPMGNLTGYLPVVSEEKSVYKLTPQVVTVDSQGRDNIVFVPVRARAGYKTGFADPEYIETLPTYRLPAFSNGIYRMFEVQGLSMHPTFDDKDILITQFVENLQSIRDDRVYVVVTRNDGILVKRVLNRVEKEGKLILKSDNYRHREDYPPIIIEPEDVLEMWYATAFISRQMRQPTEAANKAIDMEARLILLEQTVRALVR